MNPLIPLEWTALLLLALAAGVLLTAKRVAGRLPRPWNLLSPLLRLSAIACMGILLLNPGAYRPVDADLTGLGWILVDRSESMSLSQEDAPSRFQQSLHLLRHLPDPDNLLPRFLPFSDHVETERTLDELDSLSPDGSATDLLRAARTALDRAQSDPRPSRGILLLTDGAQTTPHSDIHDLAARARAHRIPISAKLIGQPVQRPDLDLRPHQDLLTVTAGSERPVRGVVRSSHLPPLRKPLRLLDAEGNTLDETLLDLPENQDTPFVLNTHPLPAGLHSLRLELDPDPLEARTDNNSRDIRVNAIDVRLRVLLLEGVPHWDSKFLAQWFRGRQGIELTTLHRLAENRYFRVDPDEDTPVASGHSSLPGEQHDFRHFDLILVGRGLDYMASSHTTAALHRFVRDHGGILIFTRGRPVTADRPALESLLPVQWLEDWDEERLARPTRTGARSGLFGDLLPGPDSDVWDQLPSLRGLRRLRVTDGLANVLLEAVSPGQQNPWPVLVSRQYGHGQLLLINGEGMWHWDFQPLTELEDRWYGDLWTQLLLWSTQAARFQPGQEWSIHHRPHPPLLDQEIEFTVERRLDAAPTENTPNPTLLITPESGDPIRIPLFPDGSNPALLGRWTPTQPGLYQLAIHGENTQTDSDLLRPLTIPPPPGEMDHLDPSENPLRSLVEDSGGTWIESDDLSQAFTAPPADPAAPSGEAVWQPHWTQPWFLLTLLSLPSLEWAIRRRKGLI